MMPSLFKIIKESPKSLNRKTIVSDIVAGIIVAIIALPLSIALAISSGVSPEKGLITAIIAGFLISFLGGSRVQIGGPTAAFVVIICGIIEEFGVDGLLIATILAGVFLIIFGLLKLGSVIKYVPYPITVGFTAGIAVTLFSTQLNDFFGLNLNNVPSEFLSKWAVYIQNFDKTNWYALVIGVLCVAVIMVWDRFNKKIPGSLIALVLSTVAVMVLDIPVETIGSKFGEIPAGLPMPTIPAFDLGKVGALIQPAITIAVLAGVESLLSAVVADGMIGHKHDSNMELIAQGAANIGSALFGGLPATGAIARTAANINNGGKTPIAGIVHAITILIVLLVAMPLAKLIPMCTLAAILIVVAYNMSGIKAFRGVMKSTKSDVLVLILTFLLTVIFDLVVAIEVGMVLAVFLFMKKVSANFSSNVRPDSANELSVEDVTNSEVVVYEVDGPLFFGTATMFMDALDSVSKDSDIVIVRMKRVQFIDATALDSLKKMVEQARRNHIMLLFSEVNSTVMNTLRKSDFAKEIGEDRFFETVSAASDEAKNIVEIKRSLAKKRKQNHTVQNMT